MRRCALHGVLKQTADDAGALVLFDKGNVLAAERDAPFVHDKRAGDGVHQGGFAGAVGADHGDKFAGRQVQADIVQRQMLVGSAGGKGFGYMGNRQHEAASFRPCFLRRRSRSACLTAGTLSASATTMEETSLSANAGKMPIFSTMAMRKR